MKKRVLMALFLLAAIILLAGCRVDPEASLMLSFIKAVTD